MTAAPMQASGRAAWAVAAMLCAIGTGGCNARDEGVAVPGNVTSDSPAGIPVPRRGTALAADESLIFFRTAGHVDDTGKWQLPIRGWVFEPEDSLVRRTAVAALLENAWGLVADGSAEPIFARRINWLMADNERGKRVHVRIGDTEFEMPATGPNGLFETVVTLSADAVAHASRQGRLPYAARSEDTPPRLFFGTIRLVEPTGISVISDIDDTVKISQVTDRRLLLEYSLFREFEAVAGMADRYSAWSAAGVPIHYVSSSPRQLYPELVDFMDRAGLPADSLSLKDVRFRDRTVLDLFKEGTETKPTQIEALLGAWPGRTFVLIGDSGEQDPEVCADLLRRYPEQVRRVFIRNVTAASADDERFVAVFDGIDRDRWALFDDPATLTLPAVAESD